MLSPRVFLAAASRLLVVAAAVSLLAGTQPAQGSAPAAVFDHFLYVPSSVLPAPQLAGRVTHGGAPASGVTLKLWFYNGASWSSIATTTTNSIGKYAFASPASLAPGQLYVVEYYNTSDASRLYYWDTQALTTYTTGTFVHMGDFDIADVALASPASGTPVGLPRTFSWTRRGAAPTDSYVFELFDANNDYPYFESAPLGYASSYQLVGLPGGFSLYTWYLWALGIERYDGAFGGSYWARWVGFTSGQAEAAARQDMPQAKLSDLGFVRPDGRRPLAEMAGVNE